MWKEIEITDTEKEKPQYYTFMAVPHSNGKMFKIRIPYIVLKVMAALTAVSLLAVVFLTGSYFEAQKDAVELEELRVVNSELEEKVEDLNDRATLLNEKMSNLRELEKKIRSTLDLGEDTSPTTVTVASRELSHQVSRGISRSRGDAPINVLGFSALEQDPGHTENVSIQDVERFTSRLESEMDSLDEVVKRLDADVADWKAYMEAKPSIWPASGRITSNFGYRTRPYYGFHNGVDIGASYGAVVKASGAGIVVSAGYDGGYGLCITVNHGYGFKTVYGHNSRNMVKVGDRVQKGQEIARVGSSGYSTGPHLHYEVHVNGQPVNPINYMQ
ncbi:MAG TPA: peptidoglycan DD-metalloendopeptidase family protein [Clostridia bacterium]|nr:peptidoglycan DD-metalloendopeptidase family protein [Clostridia bacterium]